MERLEFLQVEYMQMPACVLGGAFFVVSACTTVTLEGGDKPIEVNLNVKIDQEVRVKMDQEIDALITQNPDIF